MPRATAIVLSLVASIFLAGCGGSATIPEPASDAQAGPPPGTSAEWSKAGQDAKKSTKSTNQF